VVQNGYLTVGDESLLFKGLFELLSETRRIKKRYAEELVDELSTIKLAAIAVLLIAISNTVLIWLLGQPLNLIFQSQYQQLLSVILGLMVMVILNQSAHFIARILSSGAGLRFVGRLRNRFLGHLLEVSAPVSDKFEQGDLLSRLSHDVDEVQRVVIEYPIYVLSHILTILFYVAMLFFLDPYLAVLATMLTPLFVMHQKIFVNRKHKAASQFMHNNGKLLAFENVLISFLKPMTSFGASTRMRQQHLQRFNDAYRAAMKERWLEASFGVSLSALMYVCILAVIYVGIGFVEQSRLNAGSLVSFLIYLGYLSVPVRGLAEMPFQAQAGLAASRRLEEVLAQSADVRQSGCENFVAGDNGVRIDIQDLWFAYPGSQPLFRGVDLAFIPGETVAIVGASGSGKSTLVNVLLRFYDPQQGEILFNGKNISAYDPVSLRKYIAVVWQEPLLLPTSIRENLLLACPDASDSMLQQACVDSGSWEFIRNLELGLDTPIGEGGFTLSGGQLQRLSIARAFLRNAPILIMDEPSSALDSESEQHLMQSIRRLCVGRTTIIIAHRFSSIREADRVVYLNGDGSVDVGTHSQLVAEHSSYSAIVEWQTRVDVES